MRQPAATYNQQTVVLADNADGNRAQVANVTWSMFFPPVIKKSDLNTTSASSVVDNYDVWGFHCRIDGGQVLNPGTDDISHELNRGPDMGTSIPYQSGVFAGLGFYSRNEVLPRYVARPSRSQNALVVVDQDDTTLRICGVDGAEVVDDEVFSNITTDLNGAKLTCYLMSRGNLLGLGWVNGKIVAFKTSEAEFIDPTVISQDILPIDCVAPKSIRNTEWGLVWAGKYGLYLMPNDGGPIRKINARWSNIYDGTMLSSSGDPYIQDASTIIAGQNKMYREIVFSCMMWNDNLSTPGYQSTLMRYSPEADKWAFRRMSLTGPTSSVPIPTVNTGGGYASKAISVSAIPQFMDNFAGNALLSLNSFVTTFTVVSS